MANANQIRLKGLYGRQGEAVAAAAFTPGHMLEMDSDGKVKKHATAGGPAERLFALENALEGDEISDAYAADDNAQIYWALPGDEIQAWLNAGENVSKGNFLVSAGDGTLQKAVTESAGTLPENAVAVAIEAVDLSASGAVDTRIDVRVL